MTISANDRQVGGTHYKKGSIQHWDLVHALGLHYLQGCATKYVTRWKEKNGAQDLEKALHYIDKIIELDLPSPTMRAAEHELLTEFIAEMSEAERLAILGIIFGRYAGAKEAVEALLAGLIDNP